MVDVIEVAGLVKDFGKFRALDGLDLTVHEVGREVVLAVPLRDVRRDLLLREVADHTAEGLVLG